MSAVESVRTKLECQVVVSYPVNHRKCAEMENPSHASRIGKHDPFVSVDESGLQFQYSFFALYF